eukprot:IDg13771t1
MDIGLPSYRDIDRNPRDRCEIKTSRCGRSGIMLKLEIVKSPEEDKRCDQFENMSQGTDIARRLVNLWVQKNRIVCADSYFASVETARALANLGI